MDVLAESDAKAVDNDLPASHLPWLPALATVDHSVGLLEVSLLHTLLAEELLLVRVSCLPALVTLLHGVDHLVRLLHHRRLGGGRGRLRGGRHLLLRLLILPSRPVHILWSNINFGV